MIRIYLFYFTFITINMVMIHCFGLQA